MDIYTHWLSRDPDISTQNELKQLIAAKDTRALNDRFSTRLAFGTAGLRGKVGCGPNRMNRLVIQETSLGLAIYLKKTLSKACQKGIIIGYDGRLDSKQFATDAACILTKQGFKVYLTDQVAPTPVVAFGIKALGTCAGIVVTASHNPPEYNGFKVYWGNGAQIIPPHDKGIADCIDMASEQDLSIDTLASAEASGLLHWLSDEYYQDYRQTLNHSALTYKANLPSQATQIKLAYTAMHGVGAKMAESILADNGFDKVYSVAEQREPDGHFPTVNFPNPEEKGAMDKVIELARLHQADIACANDPDADRFAVAAKKTDGNYQMLTGDDVGALLGDFLLNQMSVKQSDLSHFLVGNSIVSSQLLKKIATAYGASYYQSLTGFKWLANVALEHTDKTLLLAYEEALGYCIGDMVWDKDGISALLVFALLTKALKSQGLTVWDKLESLHRAHGLFLTAQKSLQLSQSDVSINDQLRAKDAKIIAGKQVLKVDDLKSGLSHFSDGRIEKIDLPSSEVLIYHLEGDLRIIVRPSGTEPKVKCYYELITPIDAKQEYQEAYAQAKTQLDKLIALHQSEL